MNSFRAVAGVTKVSHILLSKPTWFNLYAVTSVKRILLFKVTELEHELQNESNVLSVMKRLSSSSSRQRPNVLFSNIWLKQALQSLAANELQRSIMYDQTGSLCCLSLTQTPYLFLTIWMQLWVEILVDEFATFSRVRTCSLPQGFGLWAKTLRGQ